jgi:hypothetical protein
MALGFEHLASRWQQYSLSDAIVRMALRATWREARATAKDGPARAWVWVSRR